MPFRVGFHSSSLPCLVGALLMELSISSVVAVGLGTLSQSSIFDSGTFWVSSVSVHSRSGMSGEVGAGGGVVELLFLLLITTPLNIIFGFLLTDLLNSWGCSSCCCWAWALVVVAAVWTACCSCG